MNKQSMRFVAINGYGVPKDILTDRSYHAYLVQVFNFLWQRYRNQRLTILPAGGRTDSIKPYQRTEAGEMSKWLIVRIRQLGLTKQWPVVPITNGLNSLENMLACKKIVGTSSLLYFYEQTRQRKIKRLAREIFGSRAKVVPIEFDGSPPRYQLDNKDKMERDDLQYSLRALKDKDLLQRYHQAKVKKIKALRKLSASERRTEVNRVALAIRSQYLDA